MRAHRVACDSHCEKLKSVAAPIPILALRVSKESPRVFAWRRSTALSNNFSACICVRLRSADICAGCREKWKSETSVRLQSEILVCQLNNVFIDMEPEAWNSRSSRLRLSLCAHTQGVNFATNQVSDPLQETNGSLAQRELSL